MDHRALSADSPPKPPGPDRHPEGCLLSQRKAPFIHVCGTPAHTGWLPKEELKVGKGHSEVLGDSDSRGGKSRCWELGPYPLPSSPAAPCCAPLGPHLAPVPSQGQTPSLQLAGSFFMACRDMGGHPIHLPGVNLFLKVPTVSIQGKTHLDGAVCSLGI